MPYKDTWSDDSHDLHESRDRVRYLSDLLCGLCKRFTDDNYDAIIKCTCPDVSEWWEAYQDMDRERIAKENEVQARRIDKEQKALQRAEHFASAYRKLTPEEREALGLPEPPQGEP